MSRTLKIWMALCLISNAGCSMFESPKGSAEMEAQILDETEALKARIKARGTLSPQEFEIMAKKLGWTNENSAGIPPPPTLEDLEKRVKREERKP